MHTYTSAVYDVRVSEVREYVRFDFFYTYDGGDSLCSSRANFPFVAW